MSLPEDDNTTQPMTARTDAAGGPAPLHIAALMVNGMAAPIGPENPLPVAEGRSIASDGSGKIASDCEVQLLFGGIVPTNGYLICNNSPYPLYVSDVGVAHDGTGIQIPPNSTFVTPPGYAPQQAVSLYGPAAGQRFAARRW
jgi:hypothetical protein